jgi:hypothetical protein
MVPILSWLPDLVFGLMCYGHLINVSPIHRRPCKKPPWPRHRNPPDDPWLLSGIFFLLLFVVPWLYAYDRHCPVGPRLSWKPPWCGMHESSPMPPLLGSTPPRGRPLARILRQENCHARCLAWHQRATLPRPPTLHSHFPPVETTTTPPDDEGASIVDSKLNGYSPSETPAELHCDPRFLPERSLFGFTSKLFSLNAAAAPMADTSVFDTDSTPFAIDPCATATIVRTKADMTDLTPVESRFLTGVGGKIPVVAKGTFRWRIEDDHGK